MRGVTDRQCTELFVGGLPTHIRVDVEMRGPQDLQTAMYYARAYEQRALAMQQSFQGRGAPPILPTSPAAPAAPTRPFFRLTVAEQLERHRKGMCFNCDEPYTPGHVCARLFYLETVDDGDVEALPTELDGTTLSEPAARPTGRSTRPPLSSLSTRWRA
jgi:hypothetical protein